MKKLVKLVRPLVGVKDFIDSKRLEWIRVHYPRYGIRAQLNDMAIVIKIKVDFIISQS